MNFDITWRSVKDCMSPHANKKLWEQALAYLKETNDADGWYVMLHGA